MLTDGGDSNWSCYATGGGSDSHPSGVGNTLAAKRFIEALAGLRAGMGRVQ